ncbi:MAG: valine--tRNA ligase [Candidatus Paceibacterota bacterium]|jgi:valyl-tRNA synthetase
MNPDTKAPNQPFKEPNIPQKFLKPYDPATTEDAIYQGWIDSGYFNPDNLPERHKVPFSIVLPPPNVTGILHMGSAFMVAIEDVMVRYARMKGFKTLWIPGTDHAAIATQSKVETEIYKKEGKRRHDLGREELLRRINEFASQSHDSIVHQLKKIGASLDWSREAYTLDNKRNFAVRTAFKKMYDDGIIYRGYRVVNWDPKGQTTISDDEIVYTEGKGKFYTFKYSKDFPISIATTRPETKVGDTGVAVHPDDPRYKALIGKEYDIDFAGEKIHVKIVGDMEVNPEFGTGAVGVTPAHSHVDYEIARRHDLPIVPVINEYAKMSVASSLLAGKKTTEAREIVVAWLKEQGLLEKEEEIPQNLSTAERTGGIVEPLPKLQWFVNVNKKIADRGNRTLKELMLDAVRKDGIKIIPENFERVYLHWIENLRDWCISRQIWFGHRIPVWYKTDVSGKEEIFCGLEAPSGDDWKQDEDTLDTWFSSGLWTFSTLGWPEETSDFKTYHPTTVLETGYDILPFWVARMILMSQYILGTIPFNTVYFHGIVRDEQGRKISKSLGNNIDPVDMAAKYGADAVRMGLIIGTGPGNDSKIGESKIKGYKNFANKVWNITRFVLSSTEGLSVDKSFAAWSEKDTALTIELDALMAEITKEMDEYKLYLVGEKLYHYVWHNFADAILEESKAVFASGTEAERLSRQQFLLHTLERTLRALHPFMPFVTEEIWKDMPVPGKLPLIIETWPS